MNLEGRVVAVAGAAGMAGTAIVKAILAMEPNARVRASYHENPPNVLDERIEYVKGDLQSAQDVRRLLDGCDCGVMAAAVTGGAGDSQKRPWRQILPNVSMNAIFLQQAAEMEIERLVVVGSASLYQEFNGPIREEQLDLNIDPPVPHLGVGWMTRYVEKLCGFWHRQSPLKIGIVRASNIFGPYARFSVTSSNFIPAIIRKAVDRMDPFEVWGESTVTRDVIYADDLARAVVLLLTYDKLNLETVNVGSGVASTVGEVVGLALSSAGHNPSRIIYNNRLPTSVPFRLLDCSKAKKALGWAPLISTEKGIQTTVAWWRENKDWWKR